VLYIRLCISKMFCDSFGIMYINMLAAAFGWFSMLFLWPGRPHTYLLNVCSLCFALCVLPSSSFKNLVPNLFANQDPDFRSGPRTGFSRDRGVVGSNPIGPAQAKNPPFVRARKTRTQPQKT
jgi:hypothetical protein